MQFLLLGAALFAVHDLRRPLPVQQEQTSRIEISDDDLRQLDLNWLAQWERHPTADEMRGLVESRIREEILYREALSLGLDKEDTIVKRRMAQKMEFLAEDVSRLAEPSASELAEWFATNRLRFALPDLVTFRHLYFSPDRRGTHARDDATSVLTKIALVPDGADAAATLADPFMFQDYYGDRSEEDVARVFGASFARSLLQLEPGSWQGPIESGYGWHLVHVDSKTPGRVPSLEEVQADVRSEWLADRRKESRRRAFEEMRARHEIVLPKALGLEADAIGLERTKGPQ